MVALLVGLSFVMGPIQLLNLYGIPYVVNARFPCAVGFYAMEIEFPQRFSFSIQRIS
jgi:hypothetical protein